MRSLANANDDQDKKCPKNLKTVRAMFAAMKDTSLPVQQRCHAARWLLMNGYCRERS
jgi:hypothetical protein